MMIIGEKMTTKKFCDICEKNTKGLDLNIKLIRVIPIVERGEEVDEDIKYENYDLCWDCNDILLKFIDKQKIDKRALG